MEIKTEEELHAVPLFFTSPPSEQDLRDLLAPSWYPFSDVFFSLVTGRQRKTQTILSARDTLPPMSSMNTLFSIGKSALEVLSIYRADFDGPSPYPAPETYAWGLFIIYDSRSTRERTVLVVEDDWIRPSASEYNAALGQEEIDRLRDIGISFEGPTDEDYAVLDRAIVEADTVGEKQALIARGVCAKRASFETAIHVEFQRVGDVEDEDEDNEVAP